MKINKGSRTQRWTKAKSHRWLNITYTNFHSSRRWTRCSQWPLATTRTAPMSARQIRIVTGNCFCCIDTWRSTEFIMRSTRKVARTGRKALRYLNTSPVSCYANDKNVALITQFVGKIARRETKIAGIFLCNVPVRSSQNEPLLRVTRRSIDFRQFDSSFVSYCLAKIV